MNESIERRRGPAALAREVGLTLGAWVKGQVLIACVLTALYAAGFAVAGLPLWFLVAPACGFLYLIPYFGYLIGMGLAALVAALGGLDFIHVISVVLIFVGIGAFESYFLTPRILGRRLGLRPLYVFLAILVAGSAFGFVGLLLVVPVLAVASAVYRFFQPQMNADKRR